MESIKEVSTSFFYPLLEISTSYLLPNSETNKSPLNGGLLLAIVSSVGVLYVYRSRRPKPELPKSSELQLPLPLVMQNILSRDGGIEHLKSLVKKSLNDSDIHIDIDRCDELLLVSAKTESHLNKAANILTYYLDSIVVKEFDFPLKLTQLHNIRADIEKVYKVRVSWKENRCIIEGFQSDVNSAEDAVQQYINIYEKRERVMSTRRPQRGTVEFMGWAAKQETVSPTYWGCEYIPQLTWYETMFGASPNTCAFQHCKLVDPETKKTITDLFYDTWESSKAGRGADAAGLRHSSVKVEEVRRVENFELFKKYSIERNQLLEKMCKLRRVSRSVKEISSRNKDIMTTLQLQDFNKDELHHEVNEHYLFHGCKSEVVETILRHGFDPKLANPGGMFGKGIYFAESSMKSDQYADSRFGRTGNDTVLYMIVARVLLGDVFKCDENHPTVKPSSGNDKLRRPPCKSCFKDICYCKNQVLYDSVMADGKWLFREFVIYDKNQCYPEYVIAYRRV